MATLSLRILMLLGGLGMASSLHLLSAPQQFYTAEQLASCEGENSSCRRCWRAYAVTKSSDALAMWCQCEDAVGGDATSPRHAELCQNGRRPNGTQNEDEHDLVDAKPFSMTSFSDEMSGAEDDEVVPAAGDNSSEPARMHRRGYIGETSDEDASASAASNTSTVPETGSAEDDVVVSTGSNTSNEPANTSAEEGAAASTGSTRSSAPAITSDAKHAPKDSHTDWRNFFLRPRCHHHLMLDRHDHSRKGNLIYDTVEPLIYSPSLKIAYLKTPKSASESFFNYFQSFYSDSVMLAPNGTLPEGTFVFTFTQNPVRHALEAYAEIDALKRPEHPVAAGATTTFQEVDRENNGTDRFLAFLDDLKEKRFGDFSTAENWSPAHAASQLATIAMARRSKRRIVNYIGHIENIVDDWAYIQRRAHIPEENRTVAHRLDNDAGATTPEYAADLNVERTPEVLQAICTMYAADFACLGYQPPPACLTNFRVDLAVYRSLTNPEKHAVIVTKGVNRLLSQHGVHQFTGGKQLKDLFGDPAPGEEKELYMVKGKKTANLADTADPSTHHLSSLLTEATSADWDLLDESFLPDIA